MNNVRIIVFALITRTDIVKFPLRVYEQKTHSIQWKGQIL